LKPTNYAVASPREKMGEPLGFCSWPGDLPGKKRIALGGKQRKKLLTQKWQN